MVTSHAYWAAHRYRRKPLIVSAMQWTGDLIRMAQFCGPAWRVLVVPDGDALEVATVSGSTRAITGDWIIQAEQGGVFDVASPAEFARAYEPAAVRGESGPGAAGLYTPAPQ